MMVNGVLHEHVSRLPNRRARYAHQHFIYDMSCSEPNVTFHASHNGESAFLYDECWCKNKISDKFSLGEEYSHVK